MRLQFIHGLEGSPQGSKAKLFDRHFTASTPVMDTSHFEGCVELQAKMIQAFEPEVLVGSSFGGAVAVALLQRGLWKGPTLLLAQAAQAQGLEASLPEGVHVWLVHARQDDIVPIDDSRELARSGSPDRVRLIEVDDDHPLHELTQSGELISIVNSLWQEASGAGA